MKKYLWIAGGAALLISAFLSRNGASHAQPSGDIKQDRRDPRRLERARLKPAKLQRGFERNFAKTIERLEATKRTHLRVTGNDPLIE